MFKWCKYYLPNFWESLLIVLVFLCIGSMFAGILLVIFNPDISNPDTLANSNLALVYAIPMVPVFTYILLRGYVSYKKQNSSIEPAYKAPSIKINEPVGRENGRKISWCSAVFLVFIGIIALSLAIEPIAAKVDFPEALKSTYEKMSHGEFFTLLSVVIMAPLCEEFIFRGTIQRGMLAYSRPVFAICWSALLFGAIHLNLFQGIAGFIMGAFIGYVYYKTHSIWLAIFAHFVNNGSSFLSIALMPDSYSTMSLSEILSQIGAPGFTYPLIVASGALLFIASLFLLYKSMPEQNTFRAKEA